MPLGDTISDLGQDSVHVLRLDSQEHNVTVVHDLRRSSAQRPHVSNTVDSQRYVASARRSSLPAHLGVAALEGGPEALEHLAPGGLGVRGDDVARRHDAFVDEAPGQGLRHLAGAQEPHALPQRLRPLRPRRRRHLGEARRASWGVSAARPDLGERVGAAMGRGRRRDRGWAALWRRRRARRKAPRWQPPATRTCCGGACRALASR